MLVFLFKSILDHFSQVCIKTPNLKGYNETNIKR
jgi:hypothetical protein